MDWLQGTPALITACATGLALLSAEVRRWFKYYDERRESLPAQRLNGGGGGLGLPKGTEDLASL